MKQNKDRDFLNAALVAKVPIELFFSLVASLILIFSICVSIRLEVQNQPQTVNEVIPYVLPTFVTAIITIPFIVLLFSTVLSLMTIKTDIDVWQSIRLTVRLQFSLVRQVGSSVGAQGSIAKLSNMRRLSSFVWVRHSGEVIICIRQDLRADINTLVDRNAMNNIANDIANITNKTYSSFETRTVNDKFIFNHFKRFEVAELI